MLFWTGPRLNAKPGIGKCSPNRRWVLSAVALGLMVAVVLGQLPAEAAPGL